MNALVAEMSGQDVGVAGQSLVFTLAASGAATPPPDGQYTFLVNWADGSRVERFTGPSGMQVDHAFRDDGRFLVAVRVKDQDETSSISTHQVDANLIAGGEDGEVLYIGGRATKDNIVIYPTTTDGKRMRFTNGATIFGGTRAPSEIVVFGNGGDDSIQIAKVRRNGIVIPLNIPVRFFGGDGNDSLQAGQNLASSILDGGAGNDRLVGSSARDLLIGGTGKDILAGGGGDDILIAGNTTHETELNHGLAVLELYLATWNGAGSYAARRDALLAGRVSRPKLDGKVVLDDAAADRLFGEAGQDWFFARTSGNKAVNDFRDGDTSESVTSPS